MPFSAIFLMVQPLRHAVGVTERLFPYQPSIASYPSGAVRPRSSQTALLYFLVTSVYSMGMVERPDNSGNQNENSGGEHIFTLLRFPISKREIKKCNV